MEGTFPQVVRNIRTDWKPTSLARSTNQEMESCFQDLLTTVKNLNAKMGDMKTRMDEKDGNIEDLKVKMGDMKTRMDEKDGDIEGLGEMLDCLREQTVTLCRELKTEKNGRQDDMNALREVRRSSYPHFVVLKPKYLYKGYPTSCPSPSPCAFGRRPTEDPPGIPMQDMGRPSLRPHSPSAGGSHR